MDGNFPHLFELSRLYRMALIRDITNYMYRFFTVIPKTIIRHHVMREERIVYEQSVCYAEYRTELQVRTERLSRWVFDQAVRIREGNILRYGNDLHFQLGNAGVLSPYSYGQNMVYCTRFMTGVENVIFMLSQNRRQYRVNFRRWIAAVDLMIDLYRFQSIG